MHLANEAPNTRFAGVDVYIGPSSPFDLRVPDFVRVLPPAADGDLSKRASFDAITVLVDGLFFQTPAVTHAEVLSLLAGGSTVIGAGSMGALRAVELHHCGMIGVGSIYHHYLRGRLDDDADLAEAVCPDTYEAVTIPLVRVRRALALASAQGVERESLDEALVAANDIHFMERTLERLTKRWVSALVSHESELLVGILRDPQSDIKASDARDAIELAVNFFVTGRLDIETRPVADLYISEGG